MIFLILSTLVITRQTILEEDSKNVHKEWYIHNTLITTSNINFILNLDMDKKR